jgi:hypothetical protein
MHPFITVFSANNNGCYHRTNSDIRLLRPDFYVKYGHCGVSRQQGRALSELRAAEAKMPL